MNTNWNDPNFQGFGGRQSPFGKRPPRPKKARKAIGTPLSRTLINLAVTLIFAAVYFYVVLPPINLQAEEFYLFMLLCCAVYCGCAVLTSGFQGSGAKGYFGFVKKQCRIPMIIAVALVAVAIVGGIVGWQVIRSGAYRDLLTVETGDFAAEVEEISYDQIPMLDKDSAEKLGNRKLGELSDMVSQFEVAEEYTQINYKGRPVRVTPLRYGDWIKWFNNRSRGLPAYLIIDMVTQNVEVVRLEQGIRYTTAEHFGRNLYRYLQFHYPTYIFDKPAFEIDEDGNPIGMIRPNDVVIFFNYRNDRAKELTIVLTQQDMPEQGMHTIPNLQYYCMTPYDASFKGVHILFDKENVQNTLGEYLAANGKTQLHIAETEKYAHVTFFFNGGRETPYDAEERILVPSPKVATYDLKPEMSAYEVKDKLVEAINTKKFDFIVVNYANGDMVGHTGIYEAIEKAVKAIDECVKDTVEAAKANDYEVIIIADHGNADHALNEDGTPNTAHSLNPVPFVYVTENKDAKVENGVLADVAPSILHILGMKQPAEMTGKDLIK